MKKKLLIMRHAKSDWNSGIEYDFDRPLNDRGRRDVPTVAAWLKTKKIIPDRIVSSAAVRTKETSQILATNLKIKKKSIILEESLYEAQRSDYLAAIREYIGEARNLLIIGHNPTLDEIVSYLSTQAPPRTITGKLMTTSALAVFKIEDKVVAGGHELEYLIRPKEI